MKTIKLVLLTLLSFFLNLTGKAENFPYRPMHNLEDKQYLAVKYKDNKNKEHLIKVLSVTNKDEQEYLLICNENFKKSSYKNGMLQKGLLKEILVDLSKIKPVGGFYWTTVTRAYYLSKDMNLLNIIIVNYKKGVRSYIFKKDNNGLFEFNKEHSWSTNLVKYTVSKIIPATNQFFIFSNNLKDILKLNQNESFNNTKGFQCLFDGPATIVTPLMVIAYQHCPLELSLLNYQYFENAPRFSVPLLDSIKINDKIFSAGDTISFTENKENHFKYLQIHNKLTMLQFVFAQREKDIFAKRIAKSAITKKDLKDSIEQFYSENNLNINDIFGIKNIMEKIVNNESILWKFKVSNWVEKNHRKYSEITVSEAEIKKFYDDYKWAFIKDLKTAKCEYYSLKSKHKFIKNEIKRLKYYRLDELLTNPPKVTINTK